MKNPLTSAMSPARGVALAGLAFGLVAATVLPITAASAAGAGSLAPAAARAVTGPDAAPIPTGNVIVLLRNQHTDLKLTKGTASPRATADRADETPVLAKAKSAGVRNVHAFTSFSGFSATVTSAQAAQLSGDPSVASIVPDLTINGAPPAARGAIAKPGVKLGGQAAPKTTTTPTTAAAKTAALVRPAGVPSAPVVGSSIVCPADPSQPLLEPEALGVTKTAFSDTSIPQAQTIVDGSGVTVAYIADGIDINNPDFIRANGDHVFTDYQDFSGDGPNAGSGAAEAFGDASAIAAQGREVYDLADHVNTDHPLPAGCNITIRGMAPGASLIGLKVFGNSNTAPTSRFIEAIDYAISSGADVLNESFGGNPFPDNGNDPITLADQAAVAAGVTVVASTGDAGTNGTVGSPASSNDVIGVGATTTFQSDTQETGVGTQLSNGTWYDDNISGLSSGGFTQSGKVPDLVAPGDLGWALCSTNTSVYFECTDDNGHPSPIQNFGGTSQSSPLTAGAAALVIEAYENTHAGVRPTPALVKQLLTSTADDLGEPSSEQGAGRLDSLAAVQAAESWQDSNGSPTAVGDALVVNHTQLDLSGNPGATKTTTLKVTNAGSSSETVQSSTRSIENVISSISGTDTLNTSSAPTYVDAFGIRRSYVAQTFSVAAGATHLDVSLAGAPASGFALRIILIDPSGAFTAYSIPQGAANFTHVDVRYPTPGTWTANFALSQSSGFAGSLHYTVTQSSFTTHGTVTPAQLTLTPGATGTFTVKAKLPANPGDLPASVQLTGSSGVVTSVPLALRADIVAAKTFAGVITGGNGRNAPDQTNDYFLQVPSGKKDLSIGFIFTDPGQTVLAVLTSPDGQVASFQSNYTDPTHLHIYRRSPQAGLWTLTMALEGPVSGNETSQPFTVRVLYNQVKVTASLPNSIKTKLPAGVAKTFTVTVHNTSAGLLDYFADGRLTRTGTLPLVELSGYSTSPLPVPAGITPLWLVPTEVTGLDVTATADQPVNLDVFYNSGEPDVYSAAVGNGASVEVNAAHVSPGLWGADVGQTGPFSSPAPAGTVTVSATAQGQLIDPALTSSTGDIWTQGLDNPQYGTPLAVANGHIGTLTVTMTPTGSPGTVVSGYLYIDTVDYYTTSGDELIRLPYTYTVS